MSNQAVKGKNTSGKTNNLLLGDNITDHWTSNYFNGNNFSPSKCMFFKKKKKKEKKSPVKEVIKFKIFFIQWIFLELLLVLGTVSGILTLKLYAKK